MVNTMTDAPVPAPTPAEPPASSEKLPFPLQASERVLRLCRRHWIYLWPSLIAKLFVALAPTTALALILSKAGVYEGNWAKAFWVVAGVYILYWAGRMFLTWYQYRNDIWVITNQRVVDIFKRHPLNLRIATADLVNIQDMTIDRDGPLRTILNYGDILCQTAAEQQEFRFTGVPRPSDIQALVDRERDRERMRGR